VITFSRNQAEVFVPSGISVEAALGRTTELGIGAHQDDLEILAAPGILTCFRAVHRFFTGVVVSDGAGSVRSGAYAGLSDADFAEVRRREQRHAAALGEYSAQIQLGFSSREVKAVDGPTRALVVQDLTRVLTLTQPDTVYTHNLADKHDTHVAVGLAVLAACRNLPESERPRRLLGCEVWRDLDWLGEDEKCALAIDGQEHLQAALLGVFDSQISGGKRYDLATLGRRRAHATYSESHRSDSHTGLVFAMDLTPLMATGDVSEYVSAAIRRFEGDVRARIARLEVKT
jgi:LmbE family N-acetylglucosaminyl deacetylase